MAQLICLEQIATHIPSIVEMSGHSMFQYGDYGDCVETQGLNYNLVELGYGGVNVGIFMGVCLPQFCSPEIITSALDALFKKAQLPYEIYDVQSHIQDYQFPYTPLFYITVIIMVILACLVLLATLNHKKESKYLKCFALQETLGVLKRRESDLNVFNGVRSFAMMWVILGHTFLYSLGGT